MQGGIVILGLAALAAGVAAQTQVVYGYTVDLSRIDLTKRAEWCRGERSVCDSLCGAPTLNVPANDCNTNTLEYTCTCQNGTAPGLEYYVNSLPTFLCEEAFKQCNEANVGNATGQTACRNNIKSHCGTLDASTVSGGGSTTTSSSTSASGTTAPTQSGASTPSTSTSKGIAATTQAPGFAGVAAAVALLGAAVAQQPLW